MPVQAVPTPQPTATRQIARAAGTIMAAFAVTQLVGLLRTFFIYRVFGTGAELDSFIAANRVAEVLYTLMAGGALGSAFIPTFTGLLAREKKENAWKLASSIANLLLLALTALSLLAFVFAPQIVRYGLFLLDPAQDPGQEVLTIELLRIMLPTVVIFGLSGLVMGILNAHQRFWLPAIAPAMYSLGQIASLFLFPVDWGIQRLAYGVLLGAFLHLVVQTPILIGLRGRYSAGLGLKLAEVREVGRLMGPRVLGVAVVQVNFIVNTIVGLSLPEGSVSALGLAFTYFLMPQTAIAQSIAIAAMPTFSAQAALGKFQELRSSLSSSLRGVLLLALPAAAGLILIRYPLFRLFESGEFTAASTQLVAWAILWYALGLPTHSLLEVVVRAFYALRDTRTPVTVTVIAMLLNVGFSLTFPGWFSAAGWPALGGLALASTLATTLECGVLIYLLHRRLGSQVQAAFASLSSQTQAAHAPPSGMEGARISGAALQGGFGSLVMGIGLAAWLAISRPLPDWLILGVGVVLGAVIYALTLFSLKVPEVNDLLAAASRRFKLANNKN